MKIKFLLPIILLFTVLIGCNENTTDPSNAIKIDRDDLTGPGYLWFGPNYQMYRLDQDVVDSIKDLYDPAVHSFFLYVQPTCNCQGTQFYFPNLLKTMDSAAISELEYEIYSMNKSNYDHPHSDVVTIKTLPAFYLLKNGQVVYSIMDSLEADIKNIDDTLRIEKYLLEAVKK